MFYVVLGWGGGAAAAVLLPWRRCGGLQSQQMGTQLLGAAGLGLGAWHLTALKTNARAAQQRL